MSISVINILSPGYGANFFPTRLLEQKWLHNQHVKTERQRANRKLEQDVVAKGFCDVDFSGAIVGNNGLDNRSAQSKLEPNLI